MHGIQGIYVFLFNKENITQCFKIRKIAKCNAKCKAYKYLSKLPLANQPNRLIVIIKLLHPKNDHINSHKDHKSSCRDVYLDNIALSHKCHKSFT